MYTIFSKYSQSKILLHIVLPPDCVSVLILCSHSPFLSFILMDYFIGFALLLTLLNPQNRDLLFITLYLLNKISSIADIMGKPQQLAIFDIVRKAEQAMWPFYF